MDRLTVKSRVVTILSDARVKVPAGNTDRAVDAIIGVVPDEKLDELLKYMATDDGHREIRRRLRKLGWR